MHTSTFWLKFGSLSPAVTLKIRSKSPKPNQLFIISQCYIHANLVKVHPPVHEISRIQESVTLMPTGSAPKTNPPPPLPFTGGHNKGSDNKLSRSLYKSSPKRLLVWSILWVSILFVWFGFYGPSSLIWSFRARSVNLTTLFLGKPPR